MKLEINLNPPYPLYLDSGLLKTALFFDYCRALNKRLVIISDSHLSETLAKEIQTYLEEAKLPAELFSFPAGEAHKTRETKQKLEDLMLSKGYARDTCVIAVGGGVVSDLAGFLAATYCRGISSIYVPTTLLAMVDASIGGKTGVNTPYGKNLIGSFHQPTAVFMDIETLKSLNPREWTNGITEVIKHSLIANSKLYSLLEDSAQNLRENPELLMKLIYESCLIKKAIVEQDEKEQGLRQLLNYGHTIGHAIESLENYEISHGEAVAIGLLVESKLSVECGFLNEQDLSSLDELLKAYQLPLKTQAFKDKAKLMALFKMDKKSLAGEAHFVLLDEIGKAHTRDGHYSFAVNLQQLNNALDWAERRFQNSDKAN